MNVVQQFNERKQQALEATQMPDQNIKMDWFRTAKHALLLSSPMTLGISARQFINLFDKGIQELTLMDFAILSNNLESKSAIDLDLSAQLYMELLLDGEKAISTWQQIVGDLDNQIKEQLAAESRAQKERDKAVGGFMSTVAEG